MMVRRPRQYAFDYLNAVGDKARAAAVAGCPPELRPMVRLHVKLWRQRIYCQVATRELSDQERLARRTAREAKAEIRAMLPPTEEYETDWRGLPL